MFDIIRNQQNNISKVNFNIQSRELNINLIIDNSTNINYKIDISEFYNSSQWYDCCSHVIYLSLDPNNKIYTITNRDAITFSSKDNYTRFNGKIDNSFVFWMDNVYKTSNFIEMKYTLYLSKECEFISNKNNIVENKTELSTYFLPELTISGSDYINANETIELTLTSKHNGKLTDRDIVYYLESSAGYLNKRKITVNGSSTFKVKALELAPGDIIEIKAGYKFRSKVTSKTITVV